MNDALELLYSVLSKFFNFMFNSYIFDGVSLGMVLLVCGLFVVLLRYLVAIPKMRVADLRPSINESWGTTKYVDKKGEVVTRPSHTISKTSHRRVGR